MTGQCDFLRKFPNFLRKQGVSAHSVYPPLCLPASPVSLPHPSSLNHFCNFNQTKGKDLTDLTALWVLRENCSAVRKDPNFCSQPCPKRNSSAASARPLPTLTGNSPTVGAAPLSGTWEDEREGGSKEEGWTREILKGHADGRQDINPV